MTLPANLVSISLVLGGLWLPLTAVADQEREPGKVPELALEPATAPPGSAVVATGSGFLESCGAKLLLDRSDGPVLGVASVEENGRFTHLATIPADVSVGEHRVLAHGLRMAGEFCTEPSGESAAAPLTVSAPAPSLTVGAFEGRPGSLVEIKGQGFCGEPACSGVTIFIQEHLAAHQVRVSADGTLAVQVQVPVVSPPGPVLVRAEQTAADGGEIRAYGAMFVTIKPDVREEEGPK